MSEKKPDIFQREMIRRTSSSFDPEHQRRLAEEGRLGMTDADTDLAIQLIRNRISVSVKKHKSELSVKENRDLKTIDVETKKLRNLTNAQREELKILLLEEEGYDTKRGSIKEFGSADNVQSIAINLHSLDFLTTTERGKHDSVIGKLAEKIIERTPSFYPDDAPGGGYKAESEIVYGLIHHNVPGWKTPLVRLFVNTEEGTYSNLYIRAPKKINPTQLKQIKNLLRNKFFVLPIDRLCQPL